MEVPDLGPSASRPGEGNKEDAALRPEQELRQPWDDRPDDVAARLDIHAEKMQWNGRRAVGAQRAFYEIHDDVTMSRRWCRTGIDAPVAR